MKRLSVSTLLPFLICCCVIVHAQERPASSVSVTDVKFQDTYVLDALESLARKYKVIIAVSGTSANPRIAYDRLSISVHRGSLKDILDALAKSNPGYRWSQGTDGVVHIQVGEALSLTELIVKRMDIEHMKRSEIQGEVFRQNPEVASWLKEHECTTLGETSFPFSMMSNRNYVEDDRRFTFHFKDESLDSILSKMALQTKAYFWFAINEGGKPCGIIIHTGRYEIRHR